MPVPGGTYFSTSDANTQKLWSKELFHDSIFKTVLFNPGGKSKHIGEEPEYLIQQHTDTQKSYGDAITTTLVMNLAGAGTMGTDTLEGAEEGLDAPTFTWSINKLRHGVKTWGEIVDQRVSWDTIRTAKSKLSEWWASRMEIGAFTHLCGWTAPPFASYKDPAGVSIPGNDIRYSNLVATTAPDTQHIIRAGEVATDDLVQADPSLYLTPDVIELAVAKAKQLEVPLRPARVGGEPLFVLFIHPNQTRYLRRSDSAWFSAMLAAMQGGRINDNPIFRSALGRWNDVLIVETNYISPGIGNVSGLGLANTRRAVLCGAQSYVIAYGRNYGNSSMKWFNGSWDHGDKLYASASMIYGGGAPRFSINGTTRDFGKMVITTYAKDLV